MKSSQELFGGMDGGKILDIATGNGYFLEFLLQGIKSYDEAVGVDFKKTAGAPFAETFKEKPKVRFAVMDAAALDFADASFDTVSISHSLHHLADPNAILKEMLRVLKPGGNFIINEMYRDGHQTETQQTHILLHHWLAAIDTLNGVVHNETYSRQQLLQFAEGLGLRQIETFDMVDLAEDPLAPEILADYAPVIERYIQRAEGHPELQAYGETMRQRLKVIGFHGASTLLIKATK
jgi:SAM-dependent methyltransferase